MARRAAETAADASDAPPPASTSPGVGSGITEGSGGPATVDPEPVERPYSEAMTDEQRTHLRDVGLLGDEE